MKLQKADNLFKNLCILEIHGASINIQGHGLIIVHYGQLSSKTRFLIWTQMMVHSFYLLHHLLLFGIVFASHIYMIIFKLVISTKKEQARLKLSNLPLKMEENRLLEWTSTQTECTQINVMVEYLEIWFYTLDRYR